jgi:hypothetical protein
MPRLAASIWLGEQNAGEIFEWPPKNAKEVDICTGAREACAETDAPVMTAFVLTDESLDDFWNRLLVITFGTEKKYDELIAAGLGNEHPDKGEPGFTNLQRSTHKVLEYFKKTPAEERIPVRLIDAVPGYDFMLHSQGLDVFLPDNPFEGDGDKWKKGDGWTEVLRYYKFRKTGAPPIGLPGGPAKLTKVKNLTAPTGTSQAQNDWVRCMSTGKDAAKWWITGSVFRGMMTEYPRIIAGLWYEHAVWQTPRDEPKKGDDPKKEWDKTYACKFGKSNGLKTLIEQRLEVELPEALMVKVADQTLTTDVLITPKKMLFPDPGPPPDGEALMDAIESSVAGNPVFTDTGCL